jgi:hypothetical protein
VNGPKWIFTRGTEELELLRLDLNEGPVLVISGIGAPRSYRFHDLTALINFQCDMEALLLNTGWSFVRFSPDRRSGTERRSWPRMTDRRRWWTDGVLVPPEGQIKPKN